MKQEMDLFSGPSLHWEKIMGKCWGKICILFSNFDKKKLILRKLWEKYRFSWGGEFSMIFPMWSKSNEQSGRT